MAAPASVLAFMGWKKSPMEKGKPKNKAGWDWVPNVSDVDNLESLSLGASMVTALGQPNPNLQPIGPAALPKNPGPSFEVCVEAELRAALPQLDPSRQWDVSRRELITRFEQYAHLATLDALIKSDPNLRVTLGRDYLIKPDVTVGLPGSPSSAGIPFLHAAVSCKWTIRSDRVQNIRHEFNQMVRHRRGRLPHLVTVTAEPLPTRLLSIARGTGEVDATFHIAFAELEAAVNGSSNQGQKDAWAEIVGQGRLKNFAELAFELARW